MRRFVETCLFQSHAHLAVGTDPSYVFGGIAAVSKLRTLVLALPRAVSGAAGYRRYLREFRSEVRVPCFAVGSVTLPETHHANHSDTGVLHYMPLELLCVSPFDSISLFGVFERIGAPLSETVRPVFERFLPELKDGGTLFGGVVLPSTAMKGRHVLSPHAKQKVSHDDEWERQSDAKTLAALADALNRTCKWFRLEPCEGVVMFCGYK